MSAPHQPHPHEPTPRLQPDSMDAMRPEWQEIFDRVPGDGMKGPHAPKNVLGMLMKSPGVFGPFLDYWVTAKKAMHLSIREQELVILRMGLLYRSNYVWKHHLPIAEEFGITPREIQALQTGDTDAFPPRERALLVWTDELVDARTLSAESWAAHRPHLEEADIIDLFSLISQYVLFALTNNALQVPVEEALESLPGVLPPSRD